MEKNPRAGHETCDQHLVCRAQCLARSANRGGRDSHLHVSVMAGHEVCQGQISRSRRCERNRPGLMDVRDCRASSRSPADEHMERLWRSVREEQILGKAIHRRVGADPDASPARARDVSHVTDGEGRHARNLMEVDEASRVQAAKRQDVLVHDLGAPIHRATRCRLPIPFEQIAVQAPVDLVVVAPRDDRRGSSTRSGDAPDFSLFVCLGHAAARCGR